MTCSFSLTWMGLSSPVSRAASAASSRTTTWILGEKGFQRSREEWKTKEQLPGLCSTGFSSDMSSNVHPRWLGPKPPQGQCTFCPGLFEFKQKSVFPDWESLFTWTFFYRQLPSVFFFIYSWVIPGNNIKRHKWPSPGHRSSIPSDALH